jgi:hypothetical protein
MKTLKDLTDEKLNQILDELLSKASMKDLAESVREDIVKRVRLGSGVDKSGGKAQKLKPLSAPYVKWRRRNKSSLSKFTSPKKSNLTKTGHMLDNLEAKAKLDKITLFFSDDFANQKAGWVSKLRPFLYLTDLEEKRLVERINQKIRELIKKSN